MRKMFTLLLVAVFTVTAAFAQETTTKKYQFGSITGIDAGYVYHVKVSQGNSNQVEVICPTYLEKYMEINAFNGVLYLKMNLPNNFRHPKNTSQQIEVNLQMQTISSINLGGAASLVAQGDFKTDHLECELGGATNASGLNISGRYLELECGGASNLKLNGHFDKMDAESSGASKVTLKGNMQEISADVNGASQFSYTGESRSIDIEASGASKATLSGKCGSIKIECSGASSVNAQAMLTNDASAEATGVSKISVYSSGILKADATTSSTVQYYGNPKQLISKPSNIRKAD